MLATEILVHGAINISDDDFLGILVRVSKFVPIGLQRLAVASPWCLELNEGVLTIDCLGEILWPEAS
jgi:hypothetical protein